MERKNYIKIGSIVKYNINRGFVDVNEHDVPLGMI